MRRVLSRRNAGALSAFAVATLSVSTVVFPFSANAVEKGPKKAVTPPASSVKLYGQINELLSACANAGVVISSTNLPARVEKVRPGSPAFYGGLQENDVIIKGDLAGNRLTITFKRGAAIYGLNLATRAGSGTPARALSDSADGAENSAYTAEGGVIRLPAAVDKNQTADLTKDFAKDLTKNPTKDPAWRKLQKYDIVMLIDRSGSMADPVLPNGLSKWDWCKWQLSTFASQQLENTGRRFTIVPFNAEYLIRQNCSPADVQATFSSNQPVGGTDLATPLDAVLNNYLARPQINPLLVVVLTDGMPAAPNLVEKTIIDATKKMTSPEQIKIVFFEIGDDSEGRALIRLLDAGLTGEGARYDIVDANTFARLQQVGLKLALYDTFNQNFRTSLRVAPGTSLESELAIVRRQIEEARARAAQTAPNR